MSEQFPVITDDGLNSLKRRIGVEIVGSLAPWCHEATRDNIRHYAHGIGDDNPLWCDPDYAAQSRFGGLTALPSFLFACDRIVSGYVGGLPGLCRQTAGCAAVSGDPAPFWPFVTRCTPQGSATIAHHG